MVYLCRYYCYSYEQAKHMKAKVNVKGVHHEVVCLRPGEKTATHFAKLQPASVQCWLIFCIDGR